MKQGIIAVDPGRTTGIAGIYWEEGANSITWFVEQASIEEGLKDLLDRFFYHDPEWIICESFQYRRLPKVDLTAVEIIGALKFYAELYMFPGLHFQPPGTKTMMDNDKLKALEMYSKGKPHANDAMRHLLNFVITGKAGEPIQRWVLETLRHALG